MGGVVESVKENFKALLGGAVGKLRAHRESLLRKVAEDEARRKALITAPVSPAQATESAATLVDARRAALLKSVGMAMLSRIGGQVVQPNGPGTPLEIRDGTLEGAFAGLAIEDILILLAPAIVKTGLKEIFNSLQYTPGPPLDERLAVLEKIRIERETCERELVELADVASSAGLTGVPLPGVEQAARIRQQDREAREKADQEKDELLYGAVRRARAADADPKGWEK